MGPDLQHCGKRRMSHAQVPTPPTPPGTPPQPPPDPDLPPPITEPPRPIPVPRPDQPLRATSSRLGTTGDYRRFRSVISGCAACTRAETGSPGACGSRISGLIASITEIG